MGVLAGPNGENHRKIGRAGPSRKLFKGVEGFDRPLAARELRRARAEGSKPEERNRTVTSA